MSDMDPKTNTEAVQRIFEKYHECKEVTALDVAKGMTATFVAVPQGITLQPLKPYLDAYLLRPERVKGCAILTDLDSLVCHALRFKSEFSAAFVIDEPEPSITVVYDYHEPHLVKTDEAPDATDDAAVAVLDGEADWCQHRARYKFPLSDEWKAWNAATGQMSQAAFAEFIEDRIEDVCDPSFTGLTKAREFAEQLGIELAGPAKLMALSRGLAVKVDTRVAQAVNLTSGETQFMYEEQHSGEGGTQLKVPGGFALAIPVFKNGVRYSIPVRLRYRVQGQKVVWWFGLHGTDRILKSAVDEAVQIFAKDTGMPCLFGAPEA
jgi:uncharacterized protein YfdQ (DUF2303 family)